MALTSLLPLTEEEKERHFIKRLDTAEALTYRQLTHAKAVLLRAGLAEQTELLGPVLLALASNMQHDGTEQAQSAAVSSSLTV